MITKNIDMVKYLLDNGADVNRRNGDGNTPLHLASGTRGEIAGESEYIILD